MQKDRETRKILKQKNDTRRENEARRKEAIPAWCKENLKPGMVVRVKSASSKTRQIIEIRNGSILAQHCHWKRNKNGWGLFPDGYVTDHVMHNITGVYTGIGKDDRPVKATIMKLVDGKVDWKPENAIMPEAKYT